VKKASGKLQLIPTKYQYLI